MRFRGLTVAALLTALPAAAQVYRWVDPDGSIHYSDNPNGAPKGAKVDVTQGEDISVGQSLDIVGEPDKAKSPGTPQTPPPRTRTASSSAPPPPPSAPEEDETSEASVRAKFKQTRNRIADLQQQLEPALKVAEEADAAVSVACSASKLDCMTWDERVRHNRSEAHDKVTKLQAEIREWKNHLDDLERWASSKSIPRAWRE